MIIPTLQMVKLGEAEMLHKSPSFVQWVVGAEIQTAVYVKPV